MSKMPEQHTYVIESAGDPAVGIPPLREVVLVHIETESGDPPAFSDYMKRCLSEWFEGTAYLADGDDCDHVVRRGLVDG
jgi:hypothetical protein